MPRTAVMGLMIDPDIRNVLLVRKAKPEQWAGLFGLPAGNVMLLPNPDAKEGESSSPVEEKPSEAIVRKFEQELGIVTQPEEWTLKVVLDTPRGLVYCYAMFGNVYHARQREDESPVTLLAATNWAREPLIPNLRWLIPLLLNEDATDVVKVTHR